MLKNALFLEKAEKIAAALGEPIPISGWPPAAGSSAFSPLSCYSHPLLQLLN